MENLSHSKSSLPNGNQKKENGCYVLVQRWEESPERNKLSEIWEKHGSKVLVIVLTAMLLIYTVVAIGVSGFEKVKWLFALTMFLWFCMSYMMIRNNCGGAIYRSCLQLIDNVVRRVWPVLRWYSKDFIQSFLFLLFTSSKFFSKKFIVIQTPAQFFIFTLKELVAISIQGFSIV